MKYDRNHALLESAIPGLPPPRHGKVRDMYDLGDRLLLVATDRISAFDVVLPNGIPDKGRVLTLLSLFWFQRFAWMPNHLLTADVEQYPAACQAVKEDLRGRSMLVRKVKILPVECIVRGYLVGSGWKEYQQSGTVCGLKLRPGYAQAAKLDAPIFTPSTKAELGEHDENIPFAAMERLVGATTAAEVREKTLAFYGAAADHAASRGILIADTKLEFGRDEAGRIVLADEVLTPDSSRFWPADHYTTGANPPSLDKQFVRDWLDHVGFNRQPPAPELPAAVVAQTRTKYLEAYRQLTGSSLP
ncbi:MAG: phosphoribosylaminoimidazolesuccinocarboxamide synthase [Lentisphaeria bacterium]|jgi:phosphoribosylaminoimidazole-succinocarboxamide synthase